MAVEKTIRDVYEDTSTPWVPNDNDIMLAWDVDSGGGVQKTVGLTFGNFKNYVLNAFTINWENGPVVNVENEVDGYIPWEDYRDIMDLVGGSGGKFVPMLSTGIPVDKNWRGVHDPGETYALGDWVIITSGGNKGVWECTQAVGPEAFDTGKWTKLVTPTVGLALGASASYATGTAVGYNSTATGSKSTATGANSSATEESSTATGFGSTATEEGSTATGYNSTANGSNSTATGFGAGANGSNSTATGAGAGANGDYNSTATGANSSATAESSTATGANSSATEESSTATGFGSTANGTNSTATGANSAANGSNSTAVGTESRAGGEFSTAVGSSAVTPYDPLSSPANKFYDGTMSLNGFIVSFGGATEFEAIVAQPGYTATNGKALCSWFRDTQTTATSLPPNYDPDDANSPRVVVSGDVEAHGIVDDGGLDEHAAGFILASPNGTRWRITVSDAGVLSAVDLT